MTITCNYETAGMQDEIGHQFGIENYNGAVLSVYSVDLPVAYDIYLNTGFCQNQKIRLSSYSINSQLLLALRVVLQVHFLVT